MGQGCLTDDQMKQLLQMIDKKFEEYFKNLSERIEKQKDEDYDEETEHDLINEVFYFLQKFRIFSNNFLISFEIPWKMRKKFSLFL